MKTQYDRYGSFRKNNEIEMVPYVKIPEKSSDIYIKYVRGETRMDLLSYEYYGDCDFWWLIMQANPQYGSLEFNIPNLAELRIPYPLDITIGDYKKAIEAYNKLNK